MPQFNKDVEPCVDDLPSSHSLIAKCHMWKVRWLSKGEKDVPDTAIRALEEADISFFPNIHTLLCIFCTKAMTSCECERTISGLRRLKTFL